MGFRAIGRLRRLVRDDRREGRFSARAHSEDGFSLIETVMALGLVFTVMLGLLASLSTGIRGLAAGRQGTGATSIAKEIVENARASDYDAVGHDLGNTTTLDADTAVTTDANGAYVYTPDAETGPEPLVGAANARYGSSGGPHPEGHTWEETRDRVDYTVRVYVTEVSPDLGEDHKRLTVHLSWTPQQYGEATGQEMKVSTLLSRHADSPPVGVLTGTFPYGLGEVAVDSGVLSITGTLPGTNLARAQFHLPSATAKPESDLLVRTVGVAKSGTSSLELVSGTPSGCSVSGSTASCNGVVASTSADNDGGTALPLQDVDGPYGDPGGTVSDGSPLSLGMGTIGSVVSKSSADSCAVAGCTAGPVGDGDGLAYGYDHADGPSSMSAGFGADIVSGSLISADAAGSATATSDQDGVSGSSLIDSVGRLVVPAIDLVTLDAAPLGFSSAVEISGVDVTGLAQAGPTASEPSVDGGSVTVSMYETSLLGSGYVDVSFTPGADAISKTTTATFNVVDSLLGITNSVTLETTLKTEKVSTSIERDGTTITRARADLANWFIVTVHLVVTDPLDGSTIADVTVEADYGNLAALAEVSA